MFAGNFVRPICLAVTWYKIWGRPMQGFGGRIPPEAEAIL